MLLKKLADAGIGSKPVVFVTHRYDFNFRLYICNGLTHISQKPKLLGKGTT